MEGSPATLLSSLREPDLCNEELASAVRAMVLEPFQPDLTRPETVVRRRPTQTEFRSRTKALAPLAMRIINQNIESLKKIKIIRNEPDNYHAAINCLVDSSFYATAALKLMKSYTSLEPLDIEKTTSNLIGKIVEVGEFARALEEIRKFRIHLAAVANIQLSSVEIPRQKEGGESQTPGSPPRPNKGFLTETRDNEFNGSNARSTQSGNVRLSSTSQWEEDMLQKYGDLFVFPLSPTTNDRSMILLVLAYQMNALRCWYSIGDGALLRYLPYQLDRPGNFIDWCKHLLRYDPMVATKQFDQLQRILFNASIKLPTSEDTPLHSYNLQVLALRALFFSDTTSVKTVCQRLVRISVSYEKSGLQVRYGMLQKFCSRFLEDMNPNINDTSELDAYFLLCDYYAFVSRKAKSYKGAFYAFKAMMKPLRSVIQKPEQCQYYHAAYAANAKLSLGSVQMDKMVLGDTYADISTTLKEITSCLRITETVLQRTTSYDEFTDQALSNLSKSIDGFRISCNRLYDYVEKKAQQTLNEKEKEEADRYSTPPPTEPTPPDEFGEWSTIFPGMIDALERCSEVIPLNAALMRKKTRSDKSKHPVTLGQVNLSFVDVMILLARMHFKANVDQTYHQAYEYLATAEQMCSDLGFSAGYRWLSGAYYTMGLPMVKALRFSNAMYPFRKSCALLEKDQARVNTDDGKLQLSKRYDILGTCCQKNRCYEDAVKAYRLALKRLPTSSIEAFVRNADSLSLSTMIEKHPLVPKLIDRFLRSSIIDSEQEQVAFASEIMDIGSLSIAQKCMLHECELKVIQSLSVKMTVSKQQSTLINTLLYHYTAATYPIRRARVMLEKVRTERTKGESATRGVLKLAMEINDLLNAKDYGEDSALLQYRRHYVAMASSWIAVCSGELNEERPKAFSIALQHWGMLLKNIKPIYANAPTSKEEKTKVCAQIDNIDQLYDHVRMLADLFGINQQLTYQTNALRLLLKLNNGLRRASEDHISASIVISATIGRTYSQLGYSGKAAIEFSYAKSTIQAWSCSSLAELTYLVAYAYHLARIGNFTKSQQVFNMAKKVWESKTDPATVSEFSTARLHASKSLVLADGYLTRALIASRTETLDTAIRDCTMALRIVNSCADMIKRKVESRTESSKISNPFAADLPERKRNDSIATACEIAFRESRWNIALNISTYLLLLGQLNMVRGSWREAQYYLQQGHALGQRLKSSPLIYRFLLALSDSHLRCGDVGTCQSKLAEAAKIQPQGHIYLREDAEMKMLVGNVDASQNCLDDAMKSFDEADVVIQKMMDPGYVATLEQLVEGDEDIEKHIAEAREAHLVEGGLQDSIQYECRPLQAMQGINTINKALALVQADKAPSALALLEKLEEAGVMTSDEIELNAAITQVRLSLVRKDLDERPEAKITNDEVLVLPPVRIQSSRTASGTRRNRMAHELRLVRDNLTLALERMLEAHRTGWGKSHVKVLRTLCSKAGSMMFLKSYLSNGSRVVVNNYATLSAYYLEMAKGVGIRREMNTCLELKLNPSQAAPTEAQWPKAFTDGVEEAYTSPPKQRTALFANPEWLETHLSNLREHYLDEHDLDDNEFQERFIDVLPHHWTVCSLSMDPVNHDVYVTQMRAEETPVVVKLPLDRFQKRGSNSSPLHYEDATSEFREIIRLSDETIHSGRKYVDQQDVNDWWATRTQLDQRLKQLLERMENDWFSGFRGLLSGRYQQSDQAMTQFQQHVSQLICKAVHRALEERQQPPIRRIEVSLALCRMLVRLDPGPSSRDLEDVVYFLLSCYEHQEVPVDPTTLDMDYAKEQLRAAIRSYHREAQAAGVDTKQRLPNDHVILIPDQHLQIFPLESLASLRQQSVSRLPCLSFLRDRVMYARSLSERDHREEGTEEWKEISIDGRSAYYVLNPSGDLVHTQKEFEPIFEGMKEWSGLVQEVPLEHQCHNALRTKDLYMYFGHSAGQSFIRGQLIRELSRCSVALLMGCSSGSLVPQGDYDPHGYVMNYLLGGSPAVVANLWDVTDKSIDQLTKAMMNSWGLLKKDSSSTSLVEAVASSRDRCHLPYLIGAAPVVYGIPVYLNRR